MLTVDLVRATRRGRELRLTPLKGKNRVRAEQLAEIYLNLAVSHAGSTHAELKALWAAVEVESREVKLAAGLLKLVEDGCTFDADCPIEPRVLRSELFLATTAARQGLTEDGRFEREAVLTEVGAAHGMDARQVEQALYSDLKSEHRLLKVPAEKGLAVVERYELAQLQAVLLRAVRVTAQIRCATPADYRDIFRKLKFRRLLFQVEQLENDEYLIEIDGPFSLFDSVTKYGLQLALMLPTLLQAQSLTLHADLRWGKQRSPLGLEIERKNKGKQASEAPRLPDEVATLLAAFGEGRKGWAAEAATAVFDLPGVGLCIPDLKFQHSSGETIFLEVLGYWSREAVWKRVELVEQGLPQKLLFAASKRLRVSEEVLEGHPSGALYVYKGTLSPKAVVDRLEALRTGAPL